MKYRPRRSIALACLVAVTVLGSSEVNTARSRSSERNEVLDWNQVFIDTLIATGTPNSSSQRLGAIVHTAIFDAFNGIERRYTPLFVHDTAPRRSLAPRSRERRGPFRPRRVVPHPQATARRHLRGISRQPGRRR